MEPSALPLDSSMPRRATSGATDRAASIENFRLDVKRGRGLGVNFSLMVGGLSIWDLWVLLGARGPRRDRDSGGSLAQGGDRLFSGWSRACVLLKGAATRARADGAGIGFDAC